MKKFGFNPIRKAMMKAFEYSLLLVVTALFPLADLRADDEACVNGNVHTYEATVAHVRWDTAKSQAASSQDGAHLATITSATENAVIYDVVDDQPDLWFIDDYGNGLGPWFGGYQPAGSPEPDGNWQWITGEDFLWNKWEPPQPDNFQDKEDRTHYWGDQTLMSADWNDLSGLDFVNGYVVETGPAPGATVLWSGNGHTFRAVYVSDGITWEAARDAAIASGGYLATVTSAAEMAFVFDLVNGSDKYWWQDGNSNGFGPWLGGYQPPGSPEPDGDWRWVTGEPWIYENWAPGQPDNYGGEEDFLQFWTPGRLKGSTWNDAPAEAEAYGYVVEFDASPPVAAGRVEGLMVTKATGGDLALTWNSSCAATDNDYAVYRGYLGDFNSHLPALCSTDGSLSASIPAKSLSAYFLVVPRNGQNEGSYGRRSDGTERSPACACVPQALGACD